MYDNANRSIECFYWKIIHPSNAKKCFFFHQIFKHCRYTTSTREKKTKRRINLFFCMMRLTYNKLSYFSLLTPCRMDERRFKAAASSRTILNIQFELKTLIDIKQNKTKSMWKHLSGIPLSTTICGDLLERDLLIIDMTRCQSCRELNEKGFNTFGIGIQMND